jgi:Holliday junction resolvasome RuvABC endonuclease subunit
MSEKVFDGGLIPGKPVAVGIDQSLTGFAVAVVDVVEPSNYEIWVYKSPYRGVQRLNDIAEWLTAKLDFLDGNGNDIYDIAMEGSVLQSQSASVLGELIGTVKLTLFTVFKDSNSQILRTPLQVPPMTLKKFVSGKGNAKKDEIMLQIYKRYGVEINENNAADAYGLARIASESVIDAVEKDIIVKLRDPKFRDSIQD